MFSWPKNISCTQIWVREYGVGVLSVISCFPNRIVFYDLVVERFYAILVFSKVMGKACEK
jgi:hypothetical protein